MSIPVVYAVITGHG